MGAQTIKWILPPGTPPEMDATVWVDVAKVDRCWADDHTRYIGVGGTGAAIGERYDRAGKFLRSGATVWMTILAIDQGSVIVFSNGRHRFAWLRDWGVKAIPVRAPRELASTIRTNFGSTLRVSRLTNEN